MWEKIFFSHTFNRKISATTEKDERTKQKSTYKTIKKKCQKLLNLDIDFWGEIVSEKFFSYASGRKKFIL